MKDEQPENELDAIKWSLVNGFTEENIISDHKNPDLVEQAAKELEIDGYRQRPPKAARIEHFLNAENGDANDTGHGHSGERTMTVREKTVTMKEKRQGAQSLKVFQKGAPAEAILDNVQFPINMDPNFAAGMKFGASMIIMGVRIGQDLATTGVQMAKPIVELAKDMRAGEMAAAENAASEAADSAATQASQAVMEQVSPYMIKLKELLEEQKEHGSPAAMDADFKGMMMEMMKPLMKKITGKITGMPEGSDKDVPDGWTVEKK
jgi:hypothetical protein